MAGGAGAGSNGAESEPSTQRLMEGDFFCASRSVSSDKCCCHGPEKRNVSEANTAGVEAPGKTRSPWASRYTPGPSPASRPESPGLGCASPPPAARGPEPPAPGTCGDRRQLAGTLSQPGPRLRSQLWLSNLGPSGILAGHLVHPVGRQGGLAGPQRPGDPGRQPLLLRPPC